MKLSTRGKYGVRAMYQLALDGPDRPVSLKSIAGAQGLSVSYLEQLIAPLRKAGLVKSVRGAHGGYLLGRPPEEITVEEIITVLDGPIAPSECVLPNGPPGGPGVEHCGCPEGCVARGIWEQLRDNVTGLLRSITLKDLMMRR
ncbi:MAG: Rrf2 family transcriptional regulator [Firmicutes bacterium]|nr:Rrf2 family transcriptional regulator [Bacillota bacterium]